MINRIRGYDDDVGGAPPSSVMEPGGADTPTSDEFRPDTTQMALVGCLLVFFLLMVVAIIGQVVIKVAQTIWGGG